MTKRRIDILLVERGLAESRAKAQAMIMAGEVVVEEMAVKEGNLIPEHSKRGFVYSVAIPNAKMVLVCSTGAMEKNIDTVIDSRFKRHGQSWTTEWVSFPPTD